MLLYFTGQGKSRSSSHHGKTGRWAAELTNEVTMKITLGLIICITSMPAALFS